MRFNHFALVVVALVVACGATYAASQEDESDAKSTEKLDFNAYKAKFHKNYGSVVENLNRKRLFLSNAVSALLSKMKFNWHKSSSFESLNQMSDWTSEELDSIYVKLTDHGYPKRAVEGEQQASGELGDHGRVKRSLWSKDVEMYADYRKSDCLQSVKHQGHCGACYVFSVIALYEWLYCTSTNRHEKVAFSEQFVLDCGDWTGHEGCNGGSEEQLPKFILTQGLELAKDYPYRAFVERCPVDAEPKSEEAQKLGYVHPNESSGDLRLVPFEQILELLKTKGPLVASISPSFRFQFFGGGIDAGWGCANRKTGHSMLLVGAGRKDTREYWLFKNSYSSFWGDRGYYKLNMKSNCLNAAYAPKSYFDDAELLGSFSKNDQRDAHLLVEHRNDKKVWRAVKTAIKKLA